MSVCITRSFTSFMATTVARRYSKIGFVGLGNMGGHMAKNLLKKSYKLIVYDLNKSAVTNLVEAGANSASNVAELSKEVEVIISMLPSNQHVLDVYTGENGVLSAAKKNVLLIDSSTVDPSVSQSVASQAQKYDLRFIDSPVSGGVNAAKDGTLTFMVGGSRTDFDHAQSILEVMGSRVVHCGDVGMGQAAKLCNNMLLAISMIGTAEAFNLGQKLGLDAKVLANIVNSSSGRCWSSDLYNPVPGILPNVPSSKNYEGGFGTTLMTKDLGLAQSAATRTQTPIPLGSLAHQIYRTIIAHGFSNKDFSVVYQFLKGKN
ncbi:3-hydroxyisobutyrate dehydrogenase, mitochondrial [Nylanderia fulva]|uniref:3-hydroxyisobutyrate dehydrogenase, mitochondrial n=1 Tax=Nylanderia fulva TaxID=613905 RepID=UPI0010FB528A|nr:3-hydroxyisobutyrate dehydrogenase, mitochondrial [Nylanderia fulva]